MGGEAAAPSGREERGEQIGARRGAAAWQAGRQDRGFPGKKGGTTMAEQRLVVPREAGTENEGRDPVIVQVRTTGDCLTSNGPSHVKLESQEEIHQCWDSHLQNFLKRVAELPSALPPLEEDATDPQAPLGRDKEDLQEENSGWSRGEPMLQMDPNISGKAWMDREKLDFCMKVQVEETLKEVDLGSQWPLQLRQFGPQDAQQHQEVSNPEKEGKGNTPSARENCICSEYGELGWKTKLMKHMRIHTAEKS
ncbi:uncharacterized protein LOC120305031 [Crotalus tigris]|uniref:uncharacterized protein LOC120305031 n=1 Tax=Crotalus tigris TaxID=88082 RepID=UPI00192F21C1|nr:uncharacterized protein LOC120305031 [Crotalus tigris]